MNTFLNEKFPTAGKLASVECAAEASQLEAAEALASPETPNCGGRPDSASGLSADAAAADERLWWRPSEVAATAYGAYALNAVKNDLDKLAHALLSHMRKIEALRRYAGVEPGEQKLAGGEAYCAFTQIYENVTSADVRDSYLETTAHLLEAISGLKPVVATDVDMKRFDDLQRCALGADMLHAAVVKMDLQAMTSTTDYCQIVLDEGGWPRAPEEYVPRVCSAGLLGSARTLHQATESVRVQSNLVHQALLRAADDFAVGVSPCPSQIVHAAEPVSRAIEFSPLW